MPDHFLTLAEIAERAGLTVGATRQAHKRATANRAAGAPATGDLPPEDIRLGLTPGWRAEHVADWIAARRDRSG